MVSSNQNGNLIGKISCYLQIVSKDPHSTAFVPLAEAFRQIGLLDDALEAARMGTAALPNFSPGYATLGRILGQIGRLDEALAAYRQALDIDRQSQSALIGLARLHLVCGERAAARQVLQQAAEFHPEDEMIANMLLALDLPRPWGVGASPAPAAESSAAAPSAPVVPAPAEAAPIPTATLAEIYVRQGLLDQAIRVYEEVLRLEPFNAAALSRLKQLQGAPAAAAVPPPPRDPLAVFEGWLRAIAMRRVHVQ